MLDLTDPYSAVDFATRKLDVNVRTRLSGWIIINLYYGANLTLSLSLPKSTRRQTLLVLYLVAYLEIPRPPPVVMLKDYYDLERTSSAGLLNVRCWL